ncbi:MAG: adaptor protein MecA [Clostridium fessum]
MTGSDAPSTENAEPGSKLPAARIFTFGSLDEVCRAARIAAPVCETPNTLYKHPSDGRYYLVVRQTADSTDAFNRLCNLLSEYSEPLKTAAAPNAFEAYYEEHYEDDRPGARALNALDPVGILTSRKIGFSIAFILEHENHQFLLEYFAFLV